MIRSLIIAAALLAGGGLISLADDPPPALPAVQPEKSQPKVVRTQPALGAQPAPFSTTRNALARYEEESAVLDAQLDVKKAYVRAAEVGIMGAKVKLDRVVKLAANKAVPAEEVDLAKVDLEAAAAHLDIRKAEMKEVEVKVKFAKKRLDDAKAAPVRAAPGRQPLVDPKPTDPRPRLERR